MQKMVYLSLGSNIGDRASNLQSAIEKISTLGEVISQSSLYETEPVEVSGHPWYLNCAVALKTEKMPKQLMSALLAIEQDMGRRRSHERMPRKIDIDILLFNNDQYDLPFLKIPHPEMQNRRFALTPLAEIAGDLQHPVLKKSITQLLEECPDELAVKKYVTTN